MFIYPPVFLAICTIKVLMILAQISAYIYVYVGISKLSGRLWCFWGQEQVAQRLHGVHDHYRFTMEFSLSNRNRNKTRVDVHQFRCSGRSSVCFRSDFFRSEQYHITIQVGLFSIPSKSLVQLSGSPEPDCSWATVPEYPALWCCFPWMRLDRTPYLKNIEKSMFINQCYNRYYVLKKRQDVAWSRNSFTHNNTHNNIIWYQFYKTILISPERGKLRTKERVALPHNIQNGSYS